MQLQDMVIVLEGAVTASVVVVEVIIECLSEEIQTVEVVETFDVGGKAAAVFGIDLDVVGRETGECHVGGGDEY